MDVSLLSRRRDRPAIAVLASWLVVVFTLGTSSTSTITTTTAFSAQRTFVVVRPRQLQLQRQSPSVGTTAEPQNGWTTTRYRRIANRVVVVQRMASKDDLPSSSSDVPLPEHNSNNNSNNNLSNHHHINNDSINNNNSINNNTPDNDDDLTTTPAFAKKLRIAKAKADIDRMLSGPDPPFDLQTELDKVVSMNPPPSEAETHNEQDQALRQLEDRIQLMEHDLYDAVKRQDFTTADAIQQQLGSDHLDDCAAVLQVNSAFYRAFSEKSLEKMKQVWHKADGSAICIHPSHKPMVGKKAILNSWKRMFEAVDGSFQRNWMEPTGIRIAVRGGTAIVTCEEHVYARRFIRGRKRQTELINQLTATNIFRKVAGNWTMVYHHASWHADSPAAKAAIKSMLAGGNNAAAATNKGGRLIKGGGNGNNHDDDDESMGADGILGIANFGPLLGGGGPEPRSKRGANNNNNDAPPQRPNKRIIMGGISGSLSDILNGSLGDLLSSSGDGSEDGTAYIQFHMDDDDMDDDDDDLDDDEDDDDDDEVDELDVTIIKGGWDKGGSTSTKKVSQQESSSTGGGSSSTTSAMGNSAVPKDALRQNCISALRKLCYQGSISPKQKRVLLTDIIACSAKGEFSMVEVAYELLCGEGEDKDAAEEEFADQCRVFATSLPDSPVPRTTTT